MLIYYKSIEKRYIKLKQVRSKKEMKVEFSRFVEIKYKTEEGICRQIFNLEHIVRVMDYGDETLIVLMNGEEFWIPKSYVNVGGILFG